MIGPSLRVTEIFHSLQGETGFAGFPTVFVRLTGCPMRCVWCDTAYAFEGGERMSIEAIVDAARETGARYATVTGGEPLAQPECGSLLTALLDAGFTVSLETGGGVSIRGLDPRVHVILDLKAPGSGESARNLWDNIPLLQPNDQVKIVIADRDDYDWSRAKLLEHGLVDRVSEVLLSPVYGELEPRQLADWILADRLPVRMQLQLHKLIWGNEPGR